MKYDFKDPTHRKILNLMGLSDDRIDEVIEEFFITDEHHFVNFVTPKSQIEIIFPKREFKRGYKPNQWNPYPEVTPPEGEDYLVTIESFGEYSTMMDYFNNGQWHEFDDEDVRAFRALPEPYKPEEPLDMHPDAVAARRYMGEEE